MSIDVIRISIGSYLIIIGMIHDQALHPSDRHQTLLSDDSPVTSIRAQRDYQFYKPFSLPGWGNFNGTSRCQIHHFNPPQFIF
jgi:hypothetical protein